MDRPDWLLILNNLYRALKPTGYIYFTVDLAPEKDIENAFAAGQQLGLPVVYGERAHEDGYHCYPWIDQVREWVLLTQFNLIEDTVGDEYHHFLV